MQSKAKTVKQYISELPQDRRETIEKVRKVILKNLPKGYEETMLYGAISYVVPLKIFPEGYLGQKDVPVTYSALASQKNYMSLYLMCAYGDSKLKKWFQEEYKKSGKKLDMGKSCLRFKKLQDLDLEAIGKVISKVPVKKYVEIYTKHKR